MGEQQKPIVSSITLFYSYAHEDELLRNELEKHLRLLQRQGLISEWHDRQILAGDEWEQEIDKRLEAASIILLLISADFLASDYCYEIEMQRALERHRRGEACVIPIILRPVAWQGAPFGNLQALPTNAKPITTWGNRDKAFLDVAVGIQQAIEKLMVQAPSEKIASFGYETRSDGNPTSGNHALAHSITKYHRLETDKPNIQIELSSPAPIIGRQVTVHQPSISAKGRVEGLSSETGHSIAGYVEARGGIGRPSEFGDIRVGGFWNLSNIPLDLNVAEQRLFFKIFDEHRNEIAKSEEIKIVKR